MKRYDQRTPRQVAHQRYRHLLALPDLELCEQDHRTAGLPRAQHRCSWAEITDTGTVRECRADGEWGVQIKSLGVRRRCTRHAAHAVRARLWLQLRKLQRGDAFDAADG